MCPTSLKVSSLSGILNDSYKILNTDFTSKFRDRKAKQPELEECLYKWFLDQQAHLIPLSEEILIEQAKVLTQPEYFGIPNFLVSPGWLMKFKKRYHISRHAVAGESGGISEIDIQNERQRLKELTSKFDWNDIYNADETALFYKLEPNKTLASSKTCGLKICKERIAIMLCSNASGTDKMRP